MRDIIRIIDYNCMNFTRETDGETRPPSVFVTVLVHNTNECQSLIQFPKLLATILQHNERRFSTTELQDINDKIAMLVVRDKQDKKRMKTEHRQTIHEAKKGRQQRKSVQPIQVIAPPSLIAVVNTKVCPTCDGALVLKTGRYGKFYGCSRFPEYRYTDRG